MALFCTSSSIKQLILLLSTIAALLVLGCQAKLTQQSPETAAAEDTANSPTLRDNGTDPVIIDLVLDPKDTIIRATWQVQNPLSRGFIRIHYYSTDGEVKWCFINSPTATSTDQCVAGLPTLAPCTEYNVTVYAESFIGAGPSGAPASGLDCTLCNSAPDKLTCNQEDTEIIVSWTEPEMGCSVNNVSNYKITWTADVLCSEEQLNGSTTMEANTFTLENTIPYSNYSVRVLTELDDGKESTAAQCQVLTQLTSAPDELTCNQDDTKLTVSWTEPNTVCSVNNHMIEWTGVTLCSKERLSNSTTVDAANFTLEDTIPYTNYSVKVWAVLEDGTEGTAAQCQVMTKQTSTPDQLHCSQEHTSIILSWTEPQTGCSVNNYNIKWTGDVLWSEVHLSNSTTVDSSNFTLENTIPYTNYSVLVWAKLDDGTEDTAAQCHVVTQQTAPSAPLDLKLAGSSCSSSLTVQWGTPTDLNGAITGYSVQWMEDNTDPGVTIMANLPPTSNMYEIVGLQPMTSYEVTVKASTAAGFGAGVSYVYKTIDEPEANSNNTGAIVGGVVGCVGVLAPLAFVIVKWTRAKTPETSYAERTSDALPSRPPADSNVDDSHPAEKNADKNTDLNI